MIRPTDIQTKEFETKVRGYDRDQVDDFLDEIIKDMSELYKDNTELTLRLKRAEEELTRFRAREAEIEKSLELTRYQCEELKKTARLEAERIMEKTKTVAEDNRASEKVKEAEQKLREICTQVLDKLNAE